VSDDARIANLKDRTTEDERTGAMRSVQSADICLPARELEAMWEPMYLERLARTYWRFLARITLGLIRVVYTETERYVVLLARPFKLLTFKAPEYEMDSEHGTVRWRIERGVLVARNGRGGHGHLEIEVRRLPDDRAGEAKVHVRVEVANFHPAIATGLGKRVYYATQAKIHVLVTNGFLRSLRRLDLAKSKVGLLVSEAGEQNAGEAGAATGAGGQSSSSEQPSTLRS
jgi:putative component of toxin-antitoxin plasmid stabilization module